MELITGAAGSLLPKLAILLISNEHSLQRGARSQARFLRSELESIQAALEEASGVPKRQLDKQFRLWVASVQEMSYDIEDVVDALHLQLSLTGSPRRRRSGKLGVVREAIDMCIGMMLPCKAHRRRSVFARRIEGINELVREVAERRDRYGVVAAAAVTKSSTETSHPWLMAMYRDVRKLVGLDGPVKEVASLLLQDQTGIMSQKQLKVVSIVGVGGLGKTTLANVTYQQVRDQFMCHAFVSVSSKLPDLKRILISIIRQFMRPDCVNTETWDEMDLINMIREFVIDKRYLVVLDDIWDTSTWAYISCALTENNCCSRIITTTRIIGVAEASCSDVDGTIYKLKPLSCDDSRKLFYKRIFNCEYGCPAELREVSGKILKKIGGLPLAIMTTASLLANKPRTIAEWYSVHTSIGTGLEKSPTVENMRWILSVSYYDLPLHLRACLLYMCIFPSGYIISTGQLILRWISEEFINKQQHEGNLYEIGEKYLYELINRSMIQPESIDAHGRVQTCRVHDMVLDLISSLSSEENFVTILDDHQETTIPNKVRRLCLQNCKEEHTRLQLESMSLSHVRSLLAFHCSSNLMPPFSRFNVLRVLDLEGCRDLENRHIKDIGKLFHLRHIGLKDTKVTNLPKEVGKLYCLQTLDLTRTSITELPSSIVGLKQLMCLYVEKTVRLPHGIGRMKSLRELSEIDISLSPSIAEELGNLKELRVLHFFVEAGGHGNAWGTAFPSDSAFGSVWGHKENKLEGAMPKLENLELVFSVRETKEAFGNFEFGLDNISDSLSHMTIRINCTCSNKTEVGEANDAVRYMASLSSNQTCKIEVIRHFEDDMALDEGERGKLHQLVHQNHGKRLKQKAALPTVELPKIGPWGGTGGRAREITVVPPCHLDSVTICSGAIVDALAFSYRDAYGQRHSTPSWGGVGGISRTGHILMPLVFMSVHNSEFREADS
ncbi:disease resistance protein RGA5-like [Oryza brachyantha]|uniref:disease resistance protein RGA5-like n=1 Tax=Oryza brachyantha TaxID=4533 RepID=UPI001ADB0A70|nr:disease resistance protein RGA5-like [Oryza brachyantha]